MSDFSDGASDGSWRSPGGRFWTSDSYRAGYLMAQVPADDLVSMWGYVILYGIIGACVAAQIVSPIVEFLGKGNSHDERWFAMVSATIVVLCVVVELLKRASAGGKLLFGLLAAFPWLYWTALPKYWPGDFLFSVCEWIALGTLVYSLVRTERSKYFARPISSGSIAGPAAHRKISASGRLLNSE